MKMFDCAFRFEILYKNVAFDLPNLAYLTSVDSLFTNNGLNALLFYDQLKCEWVFVSINGKIIFNSSDS